MMTMWPRCGASILSEDIIGELQIWVPDTRAPGFAATTEEELDFLDRRARAAARLIDRWAAPSNARIGATKPVETAAQFVSGHRNSCPTNNTLYRLSIGQ
jgi:hypothetical protein